MMTWPSIKDDAEAAKKSKEVCEAVSRSFPIPEGLGTKRLVELQPEKVYAGNRFVLFGKKRYAGLCLMDGAEPKVDSKGVERNRLDNCLLLRRTMDVMFDFLFNRNDLAGALSYVHQVARTLMLGYVEISDLVITKSISKTEYAGTMTHVEVGKRMLARDPSYLMAPGERIPYVIVTKESAPRGGANLCDRAEDPLWALTHGCKLDTQYYLDKQLSNPIARVLMWYIAPKEMLRTMRYYEEQLRLAEEHNKPADVVRLGKLVKKHLEKMTQTVAKQLFGVGAMADVRKTPTSSGPIGKFFVVTKRVESVPPLRLLAQRVALPIAAAKAKRECAACKGYEDDKIACVQRDCHTLFKRAQIARDIEDLASRLRQ
jgi:DNA polymerase delta subunit 1